MNSSLKIISSIALAIFFGACSVGGNQEPKKLEPPRPNIVYILADKGWGPEGQWTMLAEAYLLK